MVSCPGKESETLGEIPSEIYGKRVTLLNGEETVGPGPDTGKVETGGPGPEYGPCLIRNLTTNVLLTYLRPPSIYLSSLLSLFPVHRTSSPIRTHSEDRSTLGDRSSLVSSTPPPGPTNSGSRRVRPKTRHSRRRSHSSLCERSKSVRREQTLPFGESTPSPSICIPLNPFVFSLSRPPHSVSVEVHLVLPPSPSHPTSGPLFFLRFSLRLPSSLPPGPSQNKRGKEWEPVCFVLEGQISFTISHGRSPY